MSVLAGRSVSPKLNVERFEVRGDDSSLTFFAMSSMHQVYGRAQHLTGYLEAAWTSGAMCAQPAPKMHVEFKVENLRTGNELQDHEMWNLIDSKRFPKIAADLRELGPGGKAGSYAATGDITLAGLARRYAGEFAAARDGDQVALDGDLKIDVRDFGLKPLTLLVLDVAPLVKVRLHLAFVRTI